MIKKIALSLFLPFLFNASIQAVDNYLYIINQLKDWDIIGYKLTRSKSQCSDMKNASPIKIKPGDSNSTYPDHSSCTHARFPITITLQNRNNPSEIREIEYGKSVKADDPRRPGGNILKDGNIVVHIASLDDYNTLIHVDDKPYQEPLAERLQIDAQAIINGGKAGTDCLDVATKNAGAIDGIFTKAPNLSTVFKRFQDLNNNCLVYKRSQLPWNNQMTYFQQAVCGLIQNKDRNADFYDSEGVKLYNKNCVQVGGYKSIS